MLMIATWDSPISARVVVARQPKVAKNVATEDFWSFIVECVYIIKKKKKTGDRRRLVSTVLCVCCEYNIQPCTKPTGLRMCCQGCIFTFRFGMEGGVLV